MAARYSRGLLDPDAPQGASPFDFTTWVIASDGDLEEGISGEAASLAGTQRLGDLVVVWDDNRISIEGDTAVAFTEDVAARYRAYGWHVQTVELGADGSVDVAGPERRPGRGPRRAGRPQPDRPAHGHRLACTHPAEHRQVARVGAGRRRGGGHEAGPGHGPRGRLRGRRRRPGPRPRRSASRGAALRAEWEAGYQRGAAPTPMPPACWTASWTVACPDGWRDALPSWEPGTSIATRVASEAVINALAGVMPELWGGSADLGGSNGTTIKGGGSFLPAGSPVPGADPYGRVIHFGVREHAMGAVLNGIALHGLTRAFGGTFLVFSDYMRAPVRLAGLMGCRRCSSGPTTPSGSARTAPPTSRSSTCGRCGRSPSSAWSAPPMPTRPREVWAAALENPGPVGTGPDPPERAHPRPLGRRARLAASRGGYVIAEADGGQPQLLLLATGSEVAVAMAAREMLQADGVADAGRLAAVPGVVRGPARGVPGAGAAGRRACPGQRRGGKRPGLVEVRRHRGRLRVAWVTSVRRPPPTSSSPSWASRPTTWRRSPGRCSPGWPEPGPDRAGRQWVRLLGRRRRLAAGPWPTGAADA